MARFNRCLGACDDNNEALLAVVDFLDPVATILSDSIRYLHECSSGKYLQSQLIVRIN
jgi:hypothetical protein